MKSVEKGKMMTDPKKLAQRLMGVSCYNCEHFHTSGIQVMATCPKHRKAFVRKSSDWSGDTMPICSDFVLRPAGKLPND